MFRSSLVTVKIIFAFTRQTFTTLTDLEYLMKAVD